jgi:succinyl-diaminopimelate desuccinylase
MNGQLAPLHLGAELPVLAAALIDIASESHNEEQIANLVEQALRTYPHLIVTRIGNSVIATNHAGRGHRVVIAGHLDTVPANGNLPHRIEAGRIYGLGSADMKGGVAVALQLAATVAEPTCDVTFIFYESEEVSSEFNGLEKISVVAPEFLGADFAVLMEPSNANIEAGCQGTIRASITTHGERAHSARSWMGKNAIHQAREILAILENYEPASPVIDDLTFREGLNAVAITGGIAGNVIPDLCCVTVNYRFAPDKSVETAVAHVKTVFAGFDVVVIDQAPGALPGLSHPAARAFLAAMNAAVAPKFGWTDVARFSEMGTPAVNYGPGDPSIAHSQGEFVNIDELTSVFTNLFNWLTGQGSTLPGQVQGQGQGQGQGQT